MNQIRRNALFKQIAVIILCLIFLYFYQPNFRQSIDYIIHGPANIYHKLKFISTLSQPRPNQQLYSSLFAQNKQVLVKIQLAFIQPLGPNRQFINYNLSHLKKIYKRQIPEPSHQFVILQEFRKTVFIHEEFAKINKQNLTFVVPTQVTDFMVNEWNQWHICVIVGFYAIIEGKQYQIISEYFPTLKQWRNKDVSGMDLIFNADPDLVNSLYETKIINNFQIYFFDATQQLPFTQPSDKDAIIFFKHPNSQKYHYVPKPLGTSINTLIQSNYVPHKDLQINQTFRTRFTIRIQSAYFPKLQYFRKRYDQLYQRQIQLTETKQLNHQNWYFGQGWLSMFSSQDQASLWVKYVKKIAFKGSVPLLIFLGIQLVLLVFYQVSIYSTYLVDYFIFRNASRFRGMSLYAHLLNLLTISLMLFVQCLYFQKGDFLFLLGLVAFLFWQLNRVINFEYSFLFPFVRFRKTDWYKNYQKKDQKAFLIVLGPLLAFFSIYTFYPLLFQNYLASYKHYEMKYTLTQYLIKRMVFGLQTYSFVFILSIQIVLNYLTKSCNSIPWMWITVALMAEMTNNVSVPVMDSNVQAMLYLKEDLCIVVIILQKLCYKDNLPLGQINVNLKPDPNENNSEKMKKEAFRQQEDQTLRHNVIENETTDILEQKMRTLQDNPNNIIIHEFEENKGMTRKED